MESDSSKDHTFNYPQNSEETSFPLSETTKSARSILEGIFAFPPNRDTLGATAYFILEKSGNILLDCPAWDETTQQFLRFHGGVQFIFITHRGGIGKKVKQMQEFLDSQVIIQEQEAYLLPGVKTTSFAREIPLTPTCYGIWTPGHSPGSSCLYYSAYGGVLFTGRHLLPKSLQEIAPLRSAKTFHWFRQLRSIEALRDRFTCQNLQYICPGANTGFLRGQGAISQAGERLSQLDLDALRHMPALF